MLDRRRNVVSVLVLVGVLAASGTALGDVIWELEGTGKVKVKAPGYRFREKLPEQVTLTLLDDGTFTTDVIVAGTWSQNKGKGKGKGKGNKLDMWVGPDDLAAIAASYGDELGGVTIQLDEVKKFHLKPVITKKGKMKVNLKLDGLITVPELSLEGAKLKIRGFYKGYGAPPVGGDDSIPEPATLALLSAGLLALLKRRR